MPYHCIRRISSSGISSYGISMKRGISWMTSNGCFSSFIRSTLLRRSTSSWVRGRSRRGSTGRAHQLAAEIRAGADVITRRPLPPLLDPVDLVPVREPAQRVFQHLAIPIGSRALDIEAESGRLQVDRHVLRLRRVTHPGGRTN